MKKVIIIGSGIGGLVAGNLLADQGHDVTIFESHFMPGGYTAGFYRKGYYFESGTVAFEASATIFKAMKDIGVFDRIDFIRPGMRFVLDDFDVTPEDYEDFKKSVYAHFSHDKKALDLVFLDVDKIVSVTGAMNKPLPHLYKGAEVLTSMLPLIPFLPQLMSLSKKYDNMTSSEFAAKYFEKGSKLFKLFSGFGYPDMSAMAVGSALDGLFKELWAVKGGMQSWADILAEKFKESGGKLKLKSYVDRIVTKDGTAVGVLCDHFVYDADYVIAASDYKNTILNLIDDKTLIPADLKKRLDSSSVSEGYFTVYLGLDLSNEELGKHMKVPHAQVFSKPGCDFYNTDDKDYFSKSAAEIYSPSMVNPELAPEGKSSLMLQTKAPHRWMNNWGGGDRAAYSQLKSTAMDQMITNISGLIPPLKDCIEFKEAATPLTYERFTHNSEGASTGWSLNPKKAFHKDLMRVNVDTPVKNLYIGSCWAMQMGGVPGAVCAAYQCAKKIK